ncbi:hypothetical protein PENTCL1PPCAC_25090, partial [Pristionchus entomophagus]
STPPSKRTPKSRGRPVKIQEENQPTSSNYSIDAIEESIVGPPEEAPQEVVSAFYIMKKCSFPLDNELETLETSLNGTINAIRKAVTGVLDDHNIRCSIPVDEMGRISKRINEKLAHRKMDGVEGSRPEATLDEAISELAEENADMDRSFLRQELLKYILIASSQLEKLSTGTLLSIVHDLNDCAINVVDYDVGYPSRIASSVSKFNGLTDKEFQSQNEHFQFKMKNEYVKEGIRHCEEMEKSLDEKLRSLKDRGNGDSVNPWKDWPEGQVKEDKLIESLKKNRETERLLKIEYVRLQGKEEQAGVSRYLADFRAMSIGGRNGVVTKEEEEQIDKEFHLSEFHVIKMAVDNWKKGNEEGVDENYIKIE